MKVFPVVSLLFAGMLVTGAAAQEPDRPQKQPSTNESARQPLEQRRGSGVESTNIQIELTVTDSVGSEAPQRRTVSMVVVDGAMGRIRSDRAAARFGDGSLDLTGGSAVALHVDATATLAPNSRVRLQLSLLYVPPRPEKSAPYATINESMTVLLQPGKPMMVSQAADPSSDRKVTVEVTATILK